MRDTISPPFFVMKKTFFTLLALTVSLAQADPVYNITLTSGESFTNCTVAEKSETDTKFTGTDKDGKQVDKTVPNAEISAMNEAAAQKAEATQAEGERQGDEKAADATLRLRNKLAQMDEAMAKITKPTRALVSQTTNIKRRITSQLENMDRKALEIEKLQADFNAAGAADYTFDKVTADQRDLYVRDAQAAYKAMRVDMKQKKGSRKIGGLDKFEIMSERYQGIPEYKSAHKYYIKTLKALEKKWTAMLNKENASRKRLPDTKKQAMAALDKRQLEEVQTKLKESGEDTALVWITPNPRNVLMLTNGIRRVQDVFRRTDRIELHEAVGTVPALLSEFWAKMDTVRDHMIHGRLDAAEDELRGIEAYNTIMSLRKEFLPNEYRNPLRDQYKDMQNEITKRKRAYDRLKASLERSTAALDRMTTNAEAQIDGAMEAVQQALDSDIGENTMETDLPEEKPAPEQPASEQAPAGQPTAEAPAAGQPAAGQPAAEQPAAEQPAAQ